MNGRCFISYAMNDRRCLLDGCAHTVSLGSMLLYKYHPWVNFGLIAFIVGISWLVFSLHSLRYASLSRLLIGCCIFCFFFAFALVMSLRIEMSSTSSSDGSSSGDSSFESRMCSTNSRSGSNILWQGHGGKAKFVPKIPKVLREARHGKKEIDLDTSTKGLDPSVFEDGLSSDDGSGDTSKSSARSESVKSKPMGQKKKSYEPTFHLAHSRDIKDLLDDYAKQGLLLPRFRENYHAPGNDVVRRPCHYEAIFFRDFFEARLRFLCKISWGKFCNV